MEEEIENKINNVNNKINDNNINNEGNLIGNVSDFSNQNQNCDLYLKEENPIDAKYNRINDFNDENENLENVENLDFEQIKRNHMQMMNNIDPSIFEKEKNPINHKTQPIINHFQNNQLNNFANPFIGFPQSFPNFTNFNNMMPLNPPGPFFPNSYVPPPPRNMPQNLNVNYFFDCNPFALFMQKKNDFINQHKKENREEKSYFFSFSNTLLTNKSIKGQEDTEKGLDLTKMTRFNIKFINPFNGRINQTDVLIETKHVKEYGEFHKDWKEKINPIEQNFQYNSKFISGYNITWTNEKAEKSVSISPIFILLCLIDSKIDSQLIPVSWKSSKVNDEYIKIKFKYNKIMYVSKANKSIIEKIPRKITSNYQKTHPSNTLNPFMNKVNINETEKIAFVNEFENQDKMLEEAKAKKQQELELEIKKKKEKKILSKLLGNKHHLLRDETNAMKKKKKENDTDSESEENIADFINEGNSEVNLTIAELKIKYANEIKLYKELMDENNINILSKYQEVLPKLIYDARYLRVPKKIRERIFDEHVREKEMKENELKDKELIRIKGEEQELKEEETEKKILHEKMDISEIKNTKESKESNILLNSEIDKFKETERFSKKMNSEMKKKIGEDIEKESRKASQDKLKALIKSQIEKGLIYSSTPFSEFEARNINNPDFYNALQIDREFLFNEAKLKVKKILEERKRNNNKKFKDMLFARVSPTMVNENTKIQDIKTLIKHEKEYSLINSSQEKKELIQEFIEEMQKLISHSKNMGDVISNKEELEKKIAEEEFKKFLIEKIKTEISWEEANRKLFVNYNSKSYSQSYLTEEKKMQIFKDFIFNLHESKRKLLWNLYQDKIGLNQDIAWHDVQHMLQNDKKFREIIEKEREALFNEYKIFVQERILSEFHQFLNETNLINKDSPTEGPLYNALVSKLNADLRFQRLGRNPDKRDKFLRAKIRSLKYEFEKKERNEKKNALFNKGYKNYEEEGINTDWRENKLYNKK